MTLQWKYESASSQTANDIVATDDGGTVRTLQVSDPRGYAVVTWEGKDGIWETWAWGDLGWSFVAEFSSATKAKNKARELSSDSEPDKRDTVTAEGTDEAPSVKVWRGTYYGNPPMAVPKSQRKRVAAVTASMDTPQIPSLQPSQA